MLPFCGQTPPPGVAGVVGEGEQARDVDMRRVGQHGDGQDDRHHEDQVAAEVRQHRRGADADVVEQRLRTEIAMMATAWTQ